jgi:hypothetical protein
VRSGGGLGIVCTSGKAVSANMGVLLLRRVAPKLPGHISTGTFSWGDRGVLDPPDGGVMGATRYKRRCPKCGTCVIGMESVNLT